jgi:hypothetical protein
MNLPSKTRQIINPPYSGKDLLVIFGVLIILVAIPFTISFSTHEPVAPQQPAQAAGPIVFDSKSSAGWSGGVSSYKWSHAVGSEDNRLLLVGISKTVANGAITVTYGGVKLSALCNATVGYVTIWRLIGPPTGTHDIEVTLENPVDTVAGATSWFGVNQTTPTGDCVSGNDRSSVTVSSAPGEVVVDVLVVQDPVLRLPTEGSGQTAHWKKLVPSSTVGAGSSKPGEALATMSWAVDGSVDFKYLRALPIKPVFYPPLPPPCSNECSPSGAKQCTDGTHYKTCGNYDGDTCLEWSSTTSCPSGRTCSGGICSTSGGGGTPGGGGSGGGGSTLDSLQLEISVPYLSGSLKAKVEVGGVSKEVELLGSSRGYNLDLKDSKLSLNKEYNLVITSDKTLVRKVKFTPTSASMSLKVSDLVLGDLNQDNTIDSTDQLKLIDAITSQTLTGDVNIDETTNSFDWAILLANFGKKGD